LVTDPNHRGRVWVFNEHGVAFLERMPAHIILAHELIHADRHMRGVTLHHNRTANITLTVYRQALSPARLFGNATRSATHRGIMLDELATIGIRSHTDSCITENMIRKEHGLKQRASWMGDFRV